MSRDSAPGTSRGRSARRWELTLYLATLVAAVIALITGTPYLEGFATGTLLIMSLHGLASR